MIPHIPRVLWVLPALLGVAAPAHALEGVQLHALFQGKAIILVDGTRRVLKTGETTPEGIRLLATDTREETAEVEVGGKREVLRLGVVISGFSSGGRGSAVLYAEPNGHFHAEGLINGVAVRFLVDTGATSIALNGVTAQRLGIDYKRAGRPALANTAAGVVQTYNVKLDQVQVGEITLHGVEAAVIEGRFPTEALLGMSFLGRLDIKRDGSRMELEQRF